MEEIHGLRPVSTTDPSAPINGASTNPSALPEKENSDHNENLDELTETLRPVRKRTRTKRFVEENPVSTVNDSPLKRRRLRSDLNNTVSSDITTSRQTTKRATRQKQEVFEIASQ